MKTSNLMLALAAAPLAAIASVPAEAQRHDDTTARFGERVRLGGITIRPDRLIEDSRCPMNARCVWAGRLTIAATVWDRGRPRAVRFTLGEPQHFGRRDVVLDGARPEKRTDRKTPAYAYRFHFDLR